MKQDQKSVVENTLHFGEFITLTPYIGLVFRALILSSCICTYEASMPPPPPPPLSRMFFSPSA